MMSIITRRNWALRLSIILNICVLLYVCMHFGSSGAWIDDGLVNWDTSSVQETINDLQSNNDSQKTIGTVGIAMNNNFNKNKLKSEVTETIKKMKDDLKTSTQTDKTVSYNPQQHETSPLVEPSVSLILKDIIKCNEKSLSPRISQRGDYWVLYNYVAMSANIQCWQSVTYTTHADFTFLDNLVPLLERWQAPISIALHAPGNDFQPTLNSIKYLTSCSTPLVTKFVTFHLYFSSKHIPKMVPSSEKFMSSESYNCSLGPPWMNNNITSKMYKNEKKLLYPVNVGRNIARESAVTHYVLASDIELYPSPNLPEKFLDMIRRNDQPELFKKNPKVFVLPIFEVEKNSRPPQNKTLLVQMLKAGTAIPFHKKLCPFCHNVPKSKEWQEANESNDLHIFHTGKRIGSFAHWEPIFIGTNSDPLYEERLSWEGKSDKMTQGYTLCVFDYNFLILDNAFLVHRPGIKFYKKDIRRDTLTEKTNILIRKIILPELKIMYGLRKGCVI